MDKRKQERDFNSQRDNIKISTISQGKYSNSLKIELNDSSIFFVSDSFLFENNLCLDYEVDELFLEKLIYEDEYVRCFSKALDLIRLREHSRQELSIKLRQRKFSTPIEDVLDQLEEYNIINDNRYTDLLVDELIEKQKSKKYINAKLYSKGISYQLIKEVLFEKYTYEIEAEIVKNLIFLIKLRKDPSRDEIIRSLVNRGFDYSVINDII